MACLAGFFYASVAVAQQAPSNDMCLACHGDPSLVASDGRSVTVLPEVLSGSVHGQAGLECVSCHIDLAETTEWPHAPKLMPPACDSCHPVAVDEYSRSVHAETVKAGQAVARCASCHGIHDTKRVADPESSVYHLNLPLTCGKCHGAAETLSAETAAPAVFRHFQDSIHGQALARAGLLVAPNCSDCHGHHLTLRHTNPESRVFRANVPSTCGECHEGVEKLYMEGVHGTALEAGNPVAPVCSTCHTAHDISRAELESWRLQVIEECGTCHPQSIATYRDTYHGKVTSLGFLRVATCSDCHHSHDIFSKEDPRSSVSQARLVETCSTCHPGATPGFVLYDPHADRHDRERNALLYYAGRFMDSLLIVVFAFFGLHTSLWFVRELRSRRQERAARKSGTPPAVGEPPAEDAPPGNDAPPTNGAQPGDATQLKGKNGGDGGAGNPSGSGDGDGDAMETGHAGE